MNIRKIAYELYKQDWLDEHTTPEMRLRDLQEYYYYVQECQELGDRPCSYRKWLEEYGIRGSLYVCYSEFLDAEYLDKDYICHLLGNNDVLLNLYFRDRYKENEQGNAFDEKINYVSNKESLDDVIIKCSSQINNAPITSEPPREKEL